MSPDPRGLPSPSPRPRPGDPGDEWRNSRNPQEYFLPFSAKRPGVPWRMPRPQINLDKNLKDVFGKDKAVLNEPQLEPTAPPLESNFTDFADQLDKGGDGANQLQREIISSGLEIGNEAFVEFLASEECQTALARDGISIHVPSGQIFVENENTGESLFDFLRNQQDETKKKDTSRFYL